MNSNMILLRTTAARIVASVVLCLWSALALASDQDVQVSVESSPPSHSVHGYSEHRFRAQNYSKTASHTVEIILSGYSGTRINRKLVIGPDSTSRFSVLTPPILNTFNIAWVEVDGIRRDSTLNLSGTGSQYGIAGVNYYGGTNTRTLVSQGVPPSFIAAKEVVFSAVASSSGASGGRPSLELSRSTIATSFWSDQWLSYSSYDSVILSAAEWTALPAPVRDALETYLHAGGVVLVLGSGDFPLAWEKSVRTEAIARIPGSGFGALLAAEVSAFSETKKTNWQSLLGYTRQNIQPWRLSMSQNFHQTLPVIENARIPARTMMALMFAFALIIGPINSFVLARKNKRIWTLWTIPTFSLVTSLSVLAFAMFSEGFKPTVRISQVTLLDENSRRATSLQILGVYCPISPGGGLTFDSQTEVVPLPNTGENYYNEPPRTVDWDKDQHLTTGWVEARVPKYFVVRSSQTRRERVTLESTNNDNEMTAVNALGVEIKQLTTRNRGGKLFQSAGSIAPGEKVTLRAIDSTERASMSPRELFVATGWWDLPNAVASQHQTYLSPGMYLAVLSDSIFTDDGLGHAGQRKVDSLVLGITEGAELPAPAAPAASYTPEFAR